MTSTPANALLPEGVPYYITALVWDTPDVTVARTITTIRTATATWAAVLGYAEELERQGFDAWHFSVRTEPSGPELAKLAKWAFKQTDPTLDGLARYEAAQRIQSEGQPDPRGSHGAEITDEQHEQEIDLDTRLRRLMGELLGVEVTFDKTVDPQRIDPDLLRTLKIEFNPWLEATNRYNMACVRLTAFTAYTASAGGFSHLHESALARRMLVQIIEEMLDAARNLVP